MWAALIPTLRATALSCVPLRSVLKVQKLLVIYVGEIPTWSPRASVFLIPLQAFLKKKLLYISLMASIRLKFVIENYD